jgi:hypothetical protein
MVARGRRAPRSLRARSWDVLARDLLAAHETWTVHSVFRQALNLEASDGSLLGVVLAGESTPPSGNGPAVLVLEATPGVPPLNQEVEPRAAAEAQRGTLMVAGRLTIDLTPAVLWSPPPIRLTLPIDEIAARIVQARGRAAALAPGEGFAPLLTDSASGTPDIVLLRASALIDNLSTAIRGQRWEDVAAPARALSGLGPGLTPSGDDVLAGLALGIHAGLGSLPEPLARALHAAVEGRTTDLAVARVRHAVAGHADQAIHQLLTALVDGPPDDLDGAVRAVIDYGHSSGADTLVGIDRGLRLGVALLLEGGAAT